MEPAIKTHGLTKHFREHVALDDLNLTVERGEVFGYLGPNGAGKTTTIRLLLGLIRPTSGEAHIFGLPAERNALEVHRQVAYVPGEASLWPALTGGETLQLLGRLHGKVDEAYRDDLVERFDLDPSKPVRAYSKGNRQKVMLIAALMTRAPLLILDEPTAGLDPLMEQTFRACVRAARDAGQTVFLSSHILSEVEALCDRVAILRSGRLIEVGSLDQLRHLSKLTIEVTFEDEVVDLTTVPGVGAVEVAGQHVRCQVAGEITPLLHVLANAHVRELLSREPSLEELFLAHYGRGEEPQGDHGKR
jgi:ABC-2 type transport system ATP-binding protein